MEQLETLLPYQFLKIKSQISMMKFKESLMSAKDYSSAHERKIVYLILLCLLFTLF